MRYYVPKVIFKDTTYIFVGNLKRDFADLVSDLMSGKKNVQHIELVTKKKLSYTTTNVKFVDDVVIRENDTVNTFRKKVCYALGIKTINELYFWYQRKVHGDPTYIYYFISQVFKKNKLIPYETFIKAASVIGYNQDDVSYNMISKSEASKVLFEANIKLIAESLCFSYVFDGYNVIFNANPNKYQNSEEVSSASVDSSCLSYLIRSLDIYKDTVYLESKVPQMYLPLSANIKLTEDDKKLLKETQKLENDIENIDTASMKCQTYIHHVHIKGNDVPGINTNVDLEVFFNHLQANDDIPFIKYKTALNVFYKFHKQSLSSLDTDDLTKWTALSGRDDKTYMVLKKRYNNDTYISFHINTDLSFHAKLSLGIKAGETITKLSQIISTAISDLMKQLADIYPFSYVPLNCPKDVLENSISRPNFKDIIRVHQLLSSSVCDASTSHDNLINVIKEQMYPYFHLIQNNDPNVIHLQYKRVSNYAKLDNIASFVIMNNKLSKDDLIHQIVNTFFISKEEAEREVEGALASIDQKDVKKVLRRYTNEQFYNNVTIKIRLNAIMDFRYTTNGNMVDGITLSEIDGLMRKLFILSAAAKKKSKKGTTGDTLAKLEEKLERLDSVEEVKPIVNIIGFEEEEEEEQDDIMGFDDDLLALQMEFDKVKEVEHTPEQVVEKVEEVVNVKPAIKPAKTGKVKGYVLSKLYEADRRLFEYKPPPDVKRKDYASLCGWVDRRQPVVVTNDELEHINKTFPDAIKGHVKSGSTTDLHKKHNYICPKIWCPKSRVALSHDDYVKHGSKCPYPDIDEEPVLFASKSYFGEGESGLKKERYPGYLDKYIHPEQLCLPCCFKVKPSEGNRNKQRGDMCISKEETVAKEDPVAVLEGPIEKYIKGTNYSPLEAARFGLLPIVFTNYLGQESKQGNRHDGTGTITDSTDALFRQGIPQSDQSYLDVITVTLDNETIKTSRDVINTIVEHLDIISYISLENGRIMKLFIDTSKNVYDKDQFKEFYTWFKKQKKYIVSMNLQRLLLEIEQSQFQYKDDLKYREEILREFIIYQSYKQFISYLQNDKVVKDHIVLGDLISNYLTKHLNVQKHNYVLLDYDVEKEKVFISCNVNKSKPFDTDYPFVFLWKRHHYYEPIVHIMQSEGNMDIKMQYQWRQLSDPLKKLIKFAYNNCASVSIADDFVNIKNFLRSIDFRIKYYVIDYGYKLCGFILNHNLYLPLQTREDIIYHHNIRYVYISDVPNFKCLLDDETIKVTYAKICKFSSKFSNIDKFSSDGSGMLLKDGMFVPLRIKKTDVKTRLWFKNGLFILAGLEEEDKRTTILHTFNKELEELEEMTKAITLRMQTDQTFSKEIQFIIDKHNPLPLTYKQKKLKELLCNNIKCNKTIYKLIEFLKPSSKHIKMYQKKIKRFPTTDAEILLDHADILNGRLQQAIDLAQNPHKAFLSAIDTYHDIVPIFDVATQQEDQYQDLLSSSKEDVPVKWRKILRGFKIIDNSDAYDNKYIYNVMKRLSGRGKRKPFDDDLYKVALHHKIMDAYKNEHVTEIFDNPWVTQYFKKTKFVQHLDNLLELYGAPTYYPSVFDVKVMAQLAHVNLIVIGRKTTKNPDGLEVVHNNSDVWIVLSYNFERTSHYDRFSVYVCNEDVYFITNKLPREFVDIISKKMKEYNVNVVDDEKNL